MFSIKEEHMNSIADGSVIVQTSVDALPCPPPWWGELVLLSQHLRKQGILTQFAEGIRFERRRVGHYELSDFLVVLAGLRRKFRAYSRELLRGAAALGTAFHGTLWAGSVALPLGPFARVGGPDAPSHRNLAHSVFERPVSQTSGCRGRDRRALGSAGAAMECLRHRRHA